MGHGRLHVREGVRAREELARPGDVIAADYGKEPGHSLGTTQRTIDFAILKLLIRNIFASGAGRGVESPACIDSK